MVIALVVCLISGIVSNVISTNFGKVEMIDIFIHTDAGAIRGYLLVPEIAISENKVPGIVVVHGSASGAETVDFWYIELARRGYVVVVPIRFIGSPTFDTSGSNLILLAMGQDSIKLYSYIISVGITAFIHVTSQKFTGNIWAGVLINSLISCMITVANCNSITML